jgi:hypothetical protein
MVALAPVMRRTYLLPALLIAVPAAACGDGGGDPDDPAALYVAGTVRDFESGAPLTGSVSVSTQGLDPAPTATIDGAAYILDGVTSHSVFHALGAAAPTHRATYGAAIEIADEPLDDVDLSVVSEAYLAGLSDAFGVTATAARGVLLAQAVDAAGQPRGGVAADAFVGPEGALGPFFLGDDLAAAPAATETSASGWVVYFEVDPGLVSVVADVGSGYAMDMPQSPISPAAATLAAVAVTDGEAVLPSDVSFAQQVVPIFEQRGCQNCHSGSGPGRDLGNLTLDGSANLIHRELTTETAVAATTPRVNLASPEDSLVLTMPSAEDPPDGHPNITFASPLDPDYLTILVWIREGAKDN